VKNNERFSILKILVQFAFCNKLGHPMILLQIGLTSPSFTSYTQTFYQIKVCHSTSFS